MTLQVLTGATLEQLQIENFDDLLSYLPGVTAHGVGPGQNTIYIRGLATGEPGLQGSAFAGSFPNVAIYLDEQSAQLPGRNLDIYVADLDRIEVLAGPQGTLFGAGAQAGVLRYITNKPKLNVTQAEFNAGYAATAHGDPSTALTAVINLPLIEDKLALRSVIYNEKRGGYIDNIPATFARASTDRSIHYAYANGQVPANSVVINNFASVADNINPVTYQGIRVEALFQFDRDWSALLTQSYQSMEADGVFAEMAADSSGQPQPDLTAQLFNPSYDKDRFENTALTISGRIAALQLLYTGAYLVRNVDQMQDYTNYARGGYYVDYYQCVNTGSLSNAATARCFTPSSTWRDLERNTHQSHELRLTTPADRRLRALGGLFFENYSVQDQTDWFYLTALPYFNPIAPPTGYFSLDGQAVPRGTPHAVFVPLGVTVNNPSVRPPGDGFFNDVTRGYRQEAAYASVDFDLIPQILTLTGGTRYFDIDTTEVGATVSAFGCQLLTSAKPVPDPCINRVFNNLNSENLAHTYSGFRSRANLSWRVSADALLYYTWSQGFRSGGFNRLLGAPAFSPLTAGPGSWQTQASTHGSWIEPQSYAPDDLIDNELGWKSVWLERRLQLNGALYQENWNHAQIGALDSEVFGSAIVNGGNYRIRGLELSAAAKIASGLTVNAGGAWSHSVLIKEAQFFWPDGVPINFTQLQTQSGEKLVNPAGLLGSSLAAAPPFQGNIRARYELTLNGYNASAQIGAIHQSHSLVTTDQLSLDLQGNSTAYDLPGFTTYSGSLGIAKDGWLAELYAENFTDTRAELFVNYHQWYKAVTVNRPRTVGLRYSYKFRSD
jgi:iron complex outermembrane receptor protein